MHRGPRARHVGGQIMLIPTGLLIGGVVELVRGFTKLSG
jgi:hypothetical protein